MSFQALMASLHDADCEEAKTAENVSAPAQKKRRRQQELQPAHAKDVDYEATPLKRKMAEMAEHVSAPKNKTGRHDKNKAGFDDEMQLVMVKQIKKSRRERFAECLGVTTSILYWMFTFQLPPAAFNIIRWLTTHWGVPTQKLACIEWFAGVGEIEKAFDAAGLHPQSIGS